MLQIIAIFTLCILSACTAPPAEPPSKIYRIGYMICNSEAETLQRFRPLIMALSKNPQITDRSAFLVRTLLIQEYRKVLLRDPWLPAELLPADWQGAAAYQLCRNIYSRVYAAADEFMSNEFETADGPLPPPSPEFYARFGGLN